MADYKIIKYCRMCRKKLVVDKSESKKNYCDKCLLRFKTEESREGGEE